MILFFEAFFMPQFTIYTPHNVILIATKACVEITSSKNSQPKNTATIGLT